MDLEKLSPAPWGVADDGPDHCVCHFASEDTSWPLFERWDGKPDRTDADFIALARNAFDVMMRRGWFVVPRYINRPGTLWWVKTGMATDCEIDWMEFPDPFTALVEADAWYKEHIEHDVG
jgi:hypothetical protein